jgi:signal transduction histidine kinase/ligand-binding sensor domain-containing protein
MLEIQDIKKALVALILVLCSIDILSQSHNIIFNEITYKDGLYSQGDQAIFQDHKGFIWIGSMNGLQRYDGYEFKNYDKVSGVVDITEDRGGILWIGTNTNKGVYLLNPEKEELVNYVPFNTIQYNCVYKLLKDKKGIMWCAADFGLYKMEPKRKEGEQLKELIFKEGIESAFSISVIRLNKADTTVNTDAIYDLYEDSQGRLWIGGKPGLFVYSNTTDKFIRIDDDIDVETRLMDREVFKIAEENPDVLWVRTYNGLTRISNVKQTFKDSLINKSKLNFDSYSCIDYSSRKYLKTNQFLIDNEKNFWIQTYENGLLKMSMQENHVNFDELYNDLLSPEGAQFRNVLSLLEDRTGLFWIGHENKGVRKFRNEKILFWPLEGILRKYLSTLDFEQIHKDTNGNLWVCNMGAGIFKISKEGEVNHFSISDPEFPGSDGNYALSLLEIDKGKFWIGGQQSGLWELDCNSGKSRKLFPQLIQRSYINQLLKIENYVLVRTIGQGLWVCNLVTNQLKQYSANPNDSLGLRSDKVHSLNTMRNGEIWASTRNPLGINRMSLNKATGELIFLPLPEIVSRNYQIICEDALWISHIYEDKNGILWFCTNNGLVKLDIKSGEIKKWTENNGLENDDIWSIQEDNTGNLWMGTIYGLSMLDPVTGIIRNFDESDGLPEVQHRWSSFKDGEGNIYFSGAGGFYYFNPDNFQKNVVIPPIVITDFKLFNKSVEVDSTKKAILTKNISYTQEIDLKYNQNDLSLTFAALDYNDPSKNKYAYMLEGYQEDWIETGAEHRIASYTSLRPGKYIFRVKGSNNDGVWNEEGTSINIIIQPPWYHTNMSYASYGLLSFLAIFGFVRLRTRQLTLAKNRLEKTVKERTQEIERQKEELLTTLENLKRTQTQLIQSEKMAALGGLVAGVAHEINTPVGIGVTAVTTLLEETKKMAEKYKKDEITRAEFKEFLQTAHNSARLVEKNLVRAAELVQSFKQVSTDQSTEQQREFKLKDYLEDVIRSLYPKFKNRNIEVEIHCDEKLVLNSYPGAFAQVITNLVLNSINHGFKNKPAGKIMIEVNRSNGELAITYRDDGNGIPANILPRIFDPFFTTDQAHGTGLGLHIVYNQVTQQLHGTVTCNSEIGKGVIFRINLPV